MQETQKKIDKLKAGKTGGICPTCGNELTDDSYIRSEIGKLAKQLSAWEDRRDTANISFADAYKEEQRIGRIISNRKEKNRKAAEAYIILQKNEDAARRTYETAERNVEELQKEVSRIRAEKNIHEENLTSIQTKLRTAKEEAALAKDKLSRFKERASSFAFWKKEFGNLRLWLISESLTQLSVEVNNSLMQLGLRGWKISFDVEKVTKGGTVSRGFSTFIQPPGTTERIDWRSHSGGETTRLRMAGACGLASLIRSRLGIALPFECWDEPASYLASEGIDDMVSYLKERAESERRAILLITHGIRSSGDFDGIIEVVKTKKEGSVIRSSV